MVSYQFYTTAYLGDSIPGEAFPRLVARAGELLARYDRTYRVDGDEEARDRAICAMADALYYFETVANTAQSSSIGSVSSSSQQTDVSPKAQSAELYRCASLYLNIYRGCGSC